MLTLKYKNIILTIEKTGTEKRRNTSLAGRIVEAFNLILKIFEHFSIVVSDL